MSKTTKEPAKGKAQYENIIELEAGIKIKCKATVGGQVREYQVSLVPRKYAVVEELAVEIDPTRNLIRKDKFEAIKDQLTIKK